MTDVGPRGHQGRAYTREEIEARLRDALAALMADGTPFRALSVNRIVAAAGLARSTFYANYVDKAAMLRELGAHSLGRMYAGARPWIRKGADASHEDIVAGMRQILDAFREDEVVMRAVAEASVSEASVGDAYVDAVEGYARALERMIRKGVREGRLRDVPPGPTATVLAWMNERAVSRVAPGATPRELDAVAEAMADVVRRTLFP